MAAATGMKSAPCGEEEGRARRWLSARLSRAVISVGEDTSDDAERARRTFHCALNFSTAAFVWSLKKRLNRWGARSKVSGVGERR